MNLEEKISKADFFKFLEKQGFSLKESLEIINRMGWTDDLPRNFFSIITRMGKAIARPGVVNG